MVHFVGAGPGAPDLITRRGAALLQTADCIIYAGSLVNPALLGLAGPDCAICNSRTPLRMVMPYEGAFCMLGKQGDRQSAVFTFCGF